MSPVKRSFQLISTIKNCVISTYIKPCCKCNQLAGYARLIFHNYLWCSAVWSRSIRTDDLIPKLIYNLMDTYSNNVCKHVHLNYEMNDDGSPVLINVTTQISGEPCARGVHTHTDARPPFITGFSSLSTDLHRTQHRVKAVASLLLILCRFTVQFALLVSYKIYANCSVAAAIIVPNLWEPKRNRHNGRIWYLQSFRAVSAVSVVCGSQ